MANHRLPVLTDPDGLVKRYHDSTSELPNPLEIGRFCEAKRYRTHIPMAW
jgi:hypothetical protein